MKRAAELFGVLCAAITSRRREHDLSVAGRLHWRRVGQHLAAAGFMRNRWEKNSPVARRPDRAAVGRVTAGGAGGCVPLPGAECSRAALWACSDRRPQLGLSAVGRGPQGVVETPAGVAVRTVRARDTTDWRASVCVCL